jgi:DNA-binding response OmpR family regulator
MIHRVLIFGHDMTLLKTRELILSQAGSDICITTDGTEATRILASQSVHLLILCHTLREGDRSAILSIAHSCKKI